MARSADGSPFPKYQTLLDEAYRTLYATNEDAREALLATGDAVLVHGIGKTEPATTGLTQDEFVSRLMKLRNYFKARQKV